MTLNERVTKLENQGRYLVKEVAILQDDAHPHDHEMIDRLAAVEAWQEKAAEQLSNVDGAAMQGLAEWRTKMEEWIGMLEVNQVAYREECRARLTRLERSWYKPPPIAGWRRWAADALEDVVVRLRGKGE